MKPFRVRDWCPLLGPRYIALYAIGGVGLVVLAEWNGAIVVGLFALAVLLFATAARGLAGPLRDDGPTHERRDI